MTKLYTEQHEWLDNSESAELYHIGVTTHAIEQMGELVFLELPETGRSIDKGESIAVIESVKAASDVYAPIAGTIVAVNSSLADNLGTLQDDPENQGWLCKIKATAASDDLKDAMDKAAYQKFIG